MLRKAGDGFAISEVELCYLKLAFRSEPCILDMHEEVWLFCDFLGDFFVVSIGFVNQQNLGFKNRINLEMPVL